MKKTLQAGLILLCVFVFNETMAQFTLDGVLRPRAEYRHGYKTLAAEDADAAFFISQRARLNFGYGTDKMKFGVSVQDIRVWGDVSQLNRSDASLSVHQAWGEYFFTESFSVKVGRQELVYDDSRMFGNVDWAQQGRSHDLALLKYKSGNGFKIHAGFAFNQDKENLFSTIYTTANNYKSMQFFWFRKEFDKLAISVLFLNNGTQYYNKEDSSYSQVFSQTYGGRLSYGHKKLKANAAAYYQTGKDSKNVGLAASYFSVDAGYGFAENWTAIVGFEYLSGTDQATQDNNDTPKNKSFTPFYGTNHKFNGHMDYFYVGNHVGSVGLQDIHLTLKYAKSKFNAFLTLHQFSSAATILDKDMNEMSNGLGTEIDIACGYKFYESFMLKAGYSQMFATESMQQLKGGDHKHTQNWAWVMLIFTPKFIK